MTQYIVISGLKCKGNIMRKLASAKNIDILSKLISDGIPGKVHRLDWGKTWNG